MSLGWAIIGIGKLADIAIAPAIASSVGSDLVAVCSRDSGRAHAFAAQHGARRSYDEYDQMLADDDVDVVYVATPNGLHFEHVRAALEASKHVLVDKPMGLSSDEGNELIATASRSGARLGVGFQLRHKPTNVEARRSIMAGVIGAPAYLHMAVGAGKSLFPFDTWRADSKLAGGGTLLNQGAHALDLVEYITGRSIAEVTCLATPGEIEEVLAMACRLDNGALATIACNQVLNATPRDWLAVGDEGWLDGKGCLAPPANDSLVLHRGDDEVVLASSDFSAYQSEVQAFSDAVTEATAVNGDGAVGLRNIHLIEACYESVRLGRPVGTAPSSR